MRYKLEFTEEFDEDLSQVIWWYSLQRVGLENDFLQSFQDAIHFVEKNPFVSQIEHKDVRRYALKRFPYKMYFKVYSNTIRFYALFHVKRNPEFVRKRF